MQSLLTFFIPIRCAFGAKIISSALGRMGGACLESDRVINRLLKAQGNIHFLSATVHDFSEEDEACPPNFALLIEVTADGGGEATLGRVAQALELPFDQGDERSLASFFPTHCGQGRQETLIGFLKRHYLHASSDCGHTSGLCFQGTPGLSVKRIRDENRLADAAFAEIRHVDPNLPALQRLEKLRACLTINKSYAEALNPPPSPLAQAAIDDLRDKAAPKPPLKRIKLWFRTLPLTLGLGVLVYMLMPVLFWALVFGAAFLAFLIVTLVIVPLRLSETSERPSEIFIKPKTYRALANQENRSALNHMVAVSTMKQGLFRRFLIRLGFFTIGYLVDNHYKAGQLNTLSSIHFARWLRIPGTRKLVFLSNYSGSWEGYLEDFVTKANWGLNMIWGNCVGYPRTRWLLYGGASKGDPFKRWARRQQIPTGYWFTAYPDLTTHDICRNTTIQALLSRGETPQEARELLHLLGQTSVPEAALETHEIQSLAFGGLGRFRSSRALALDLSHIERPDRMRALYDFILKSVGYGEVARGQLRLQMAFTHEGFEKLGLFNGFSESHRHRFSPAFEDGMNSLSRAAILGDQPLSDQPPWSWGSQDNPAHMLVLCYGRTEQEVENCCRQIESKAKLAGVRIAYSLATSLPTTLGKAAETTEAFGFRDGISQPLIKGTARCAKADDPSNTVNPGEFILGYADNNGVRPASFGVPADRDTEQLLPAFRGEGQARFHDFGRNGSYLVVRQLAQDVAAFNRYCTKAANKARAQGYRMAHADWIKAKMLGRWPDGRSLVRHPHERAPSPGIKVQPDNDFSFYEEDPHGLACPMGAHIRRANPRDMLTSKGDTQTQIKINNRRRLLRVGRPYGTGDEVTDTAEQGLLFMCLNGDIERQFEFVQQSWLGKDSFGNLRGEVDPLSHREGRRGRRFTIQHPGRNLELKGLPQFVEVRGGGYFFLPSRSALRYLRDQIGTV